MKNHVTRVGLDAVLGGALVVALGCGSSGSGSPPLPAVDAGSGTLQLIVADTSTLTADKKPVPLANASVAFYPPGGAPAVEATSDPDGKVTFSGIDWSKGKGSLVAYAPQRTTSVLVDVGADFASSDTSKYFHVDSLVMVCERLASSTERPIVTGVISNKADAAHFVTLAASRPGGTYQAQGTKYAIRVQNDAPFSLFATEWQTETAPAIQTFFKWIRVDAPAGATKVDVDFATATALATTKSSRTLVLPGGASGPLGGASAYFAMSAVDTQAPLGYATAATTAPDGSSIAIDVETVTNPGVPFIAMNYLTMTDGAMSIISEALGPVPGATVSGFLAPPALAAATPKVADPVQLDSLDASAHAGFFFFDGIGDVLLVAQPLGRAGAASITVTVPTLPAAVLEVLGNRSLVLQAWTKPPSVAGDTGYATHYAQSRTVQLTK